jgi:hypothetical protein
LVASAQNGKEVPRDRFLLRLEELLEVFGGRRLLHEDEELMAGAYLLVPALLAVDPGVQGAARRAPVWARARAWSCFRRREDENLRPSAATSKVRKGTPERWKTSARWVKHSG